MRDTFWNAAVPRAMSIYAGLVFALLWVGLAVALVVNPAWLEAAWNGVQGLPWLPRIALWVLFLPIMVGLWIWQSAWPIPIRLLGFAALVGWTLLAAASLYRSLPIFSADPGRWSV
ncbi:MAG TPA: hypothetical protein VL334_25720 [Anaerolineae bacterium]|nr:hypothetical protein [Anaerolineae bacterium]